MLGDFARRLGDRRLLTAAGTVAVMVGLLGPFGTYLVSGPVARILFWVGVIGASLPVAVGCRVVVEHHLAGHGRWTRALAVCTGFTALYAPLLHGFIHARTGPEHMLWMNFGEIAASVFLIALTVNVIDHAVGLGAVRTPVARPAMAPERRALTPPPSAPAADAPPLPAPETPAPLPRLVARLPEALRAEGKLEMTGGFSDRSGGAYVLKAASLEEAQALAAADPLETSGSSAITVYEWNTR